MKFKYQKRNLIYILLCLEILQDSTQIIEIEEWGPHFLVIVVHTKKLPVDINKGTTNPNLTRHGDHQLCKQG
jgi:hypothetical protein